MNKVIKIAVLFFALACKPSLKTTMNSVSNEPLFLDSLLMGNPVLKPFLAQKDSLNIQIIYTKIDRSKNNTPSFTTHLYNVNEHNYFYPASTVKMPVAFLALEKLNELKNQKIDRNAIMITDSSFNGQKPWYSFNPKGSVGKYVEEIFLVSDNEAYNRLYEFLGQEYIQQKLKEKGYENATIRHRLSVSLSDDQNRKTNRVTLLDQANTPIYTQPEQTSKAIFKEQVVKLGNGYLSSGKLVNKPFDFSTKNRISLADLTSVLKAMLFPGSVNKNERFNLSEEDRSYLLRQLSAYPQEALQHKYLPAEYPQTYVKFLLEGLKDFPSFKNIRCFSKSGMAYGFLTDVTYIVDFENKVEFMLSATILSNQDGIYNDDKYDFETIGYPFMKELARTIYNYELKRERLYKPNLGTFQIHY